MDSIYVSISLVPFALTSVRTKRIIGEIIILLIWTTLAIAIAIAMLYPSVGGSASVMEHGEVQMEKWALHVQTDAIIMYYPNKTTVVLVQVG